MAAQPIPLTEYESTEEILDAKKLSQRSIERRAIEAAIWGMPAVNYDLMLQEMLTKTPGKVNQVIYWESRSTGGIRRSRQIPTRST